MWGEFSNKVLKVKVQHSCQLNTAVVFCPYATSRSKVVGWAGAQGWMDSMGKGLTLIRAGDVELWSWINNCIEMRDVLIKPAAENHFLDFHWCVKHRLLNQKKESWDYSMLFHAHLEQLGGVSSVSLTSATSAIVSVFSSLTLLSKESQT